MTSLTLLRGRPRCQWLLSWMNNVYFSGSLPLSSECFSTGRRCTLQDVELGWRWYSCCDFLVRVMFLCVSFSNRGHGVSINKCVKHMHMVNTQACDLHMASLALCISFFAIVLGQDGSKVRMKDKKGSFIHLAHTRTPPSQAFHLYSHRLLLFCQSHWSERRREEGREGGREMEEGCQGRGENSGWRRKKTTSDFQLPVSVPRPTQITSI